MWNLVWSWPGPQRVRSFLWLALHNRLLTNQERARRHLCNVDTCDIRLGHVETVLHVLRDCTIARRVWSAFLPPDKRTSFFAYHWTLQGWLQVNLKPSNGLVNNLPWHFLFGGLCRDATGNWLFGFVASYGISSILGAELWSMYEGLKLAYDRGYRKVILECDNLTVVNTILGVSNNQCILRCLVDSIRSLLLKDWDVQISHIYREANFSADWLASMAYSLPLGRHFLEEPPVSILSWLFHDVVGVSYNRSVVA
ncbi:hypothetical protein P3X46_024587 [Hevea brasiliensis]|uniref:RNase H type-1 domain-containing protein n=1 Tax=Hevea brasiliensis TaxID=3981 RepID=A0ABQ9L415_HEVBR|nr:hypothetical protein P3X46_024587 [Hevea brasiliensis]